jgi:hypothetical protein
MVLQDYCSILCGCDVQAKKQYKIGIMFFITELLLLNKYSIIKVLQVFFRIFSAFLEEAFDFKSVYTHKLLFLAYRQNHLFRSK